MDIGELTRTNITVETVNNALLLELANWRNNPEIAAGIAHACGARSVDELNDSVAFPIYGFWLEPSQPIFTVWLLAADAFLLHERSLQGEMLTLTVPRRRIRRVVESSDKVNLNLTIEIDADRLIVEVGGNGDDEGNIALTGRAIHAGYTISADLNDANRVSNLYELARSVHRFTQL